MALDPETKVADIENQRIIVQSAQDFAGKNIQSYS